MTRRVDSDEPHAWRLRGGRFSIPWQTYCVTKCTSGRRPILADRRAAEIVIASLAHVRSENAIRLLAFMIMPDHYHAILALAPGTDLSQLLQRVGSYTATRICDELRVAAIVWQAGFHDRACRKDQEVIGMAEYLHHNPVRKGLVSRAEDWPFSSAHPSRRHMLDWEWWLGVRS